MVANTVSIIYQTVFYYAIHNCLKEAQSLKNKVVENIVLLFSTVEL